VRKGADDGGGKEKVSEFREEQVIWNLERDNLEEIRIADTMKVVEIVLRVYSIAVTCYDLM
jgi:hypothetical protein